MNRVLTKWIQIFRPLLSLAVYHALRLGQKPDNCFAQTLQLVISPTFTSSNVPRSTRDIEHAFRLDQALVIDVETIKSSFAPAQQAFDKAYEQTHEERARNPNAIGFPVITILVPTESTMRQVPVGLEKLEIPWDALWEESLRRHINSGNPRL
ncbi:hypothetical protein JR316_0009052 [Psilocybe cubensis]|uniref:Uncharacterized protein n=2 Tax=Psilocybe cubensis TaxID=181762 RepID=A0A8H7XYW8_PSICU|nr:hypothetical protein JR316_0009052 [Psilocybe cubensis]KAH9478595.1 hypothetical protein JR316_0009052 [Psilocybe cubensis]